MLNCKSIFNTNFDFKRNYSLLFEDSQRVLKNITIYPISRLGNIHLNVTSTIDYNIKLNT